MSPGGLYRSVSLSFFHFLVDVGSEALGALDGQRGIGAALPRGAARGQLTLAAQILPPLPYKYPEQVVFYGSSITQGLAASHAGRTYVDQVCRALDTEYLNLGFSGSARGEDSIREYIASLPMSAFVLDYDHNAPSLDHLRATHEPLYRAVRKAHPDIPILIMNRPDFYDWLDDDHERRAIVRATYEKALAEGDERVWFIDGESFFGEGIARFDYTVDGCHPNDAGFDRMAAVVLPVLCEMLESRAK